MGSPSHGATTSRSSEAVERLHDQLQASLAALVTSEDWQQALEVAAQFHSYSFSNSQLIWTQATERGFRPSRVTGYRTWRSLGRQVRKGEKGLAILAPIIRKIEVDDPGSAGKETERRVVGFRPVHVFDISQTDGPPLPDPSPVLLEGDLPYTWETVARMIQDSGYSLRLDDDPGRLGSANGLTDMIAKDVLVKESLSGAQRFKTAVHELAHIRLHEPGADGRPDCRGTVEVEAESVAYVVCASLGLDTSDYSLPYVASWSGGDLDTVAATANRVIGCAHHVIECLEAERRLEPAGLEPAGLEPQPAGPVRVSDRQVWEVAGEPPMLAGRATELAEVLTATVDFYREHLLRPASSRARAYLSSRGFSSDTADEWQLGYAPPSWNALTQYLQAEGFEQDVMVAAGVAGQADTGRCYDLMRGRIIFPVLDREGNPRGLAGRQIAGDGPKYLNGPDTALYTKRQLLYGFHRARKSIHAKGEAIVVEGYTDVIAAHQAEFSNVVGTSGTALTEDQLDTLTNAAGMVTLAFDGDSAGARAAERYSGILLDADADIRVATLPPGEDPASIVASGGGSSFADVIASAQPVALYLVDRVVDGVDLGEVEGPIRAVFKTARQLGILDLSTQSSVVEHLAARIRRDPEFVASTLQRYSTSARKDRGLAQGLA